MRTRGFGPRRIARQHDNARALLGKHFGNRLADAHRSAGDHHDLPVKFHARVVFSAARQVKVRVRRSAIAILSYNRCVLFRCATIRWQAMKQAKIGDSLALLPVFPLDLVLLPGAPLPLHIFEPRYIEMIRECRASEVPFGVIRALDEGIVDIGCTAEIVSARKNIRMVVSILVAEGRQRFEVLELNRDRSFLRAEIRFVPDEPVPASEADKARAIRAHLEILSLAGAVQDLSAAD